MDVKEITGILEENNFSEVEVLKTQEDMIFVKFYMDFDNDVTEAAKKYANTESNYEEGTDKWYQEYYIPYLYDFANDEVLEVVEEIIEEYDISGEFMAFQMDKTRLDFVQFMVMFTDGDSDVALEDLVKDYIS